MQTNPEQKTIRLPSGETVPVKVPTSPERNVRKHMLAHCKYHIPLQTLEANLAKGLWPTIALIQQTPGVQKLATSEIWKGNQEEWQSHMRSQEQEKAQKRIAKLRSIRCAQAALKKITVDEWAALKRIFTIQRQFTG